MLRFCNSAFLFHDLIEKNLVSLRGKHRIGDLPGFQVSGWSVPLQPHQENRSMPTSMLVNQGPWGHFIKAF